jgi:DnaK suppressor protein
VERNRENPRIAQNTGRPDTAEEDTMARSDALNQLQKTLTARRNELRRRLGAELAGLSHAGSADSAASAAESVGHEITSQLAALEARELQQIENALKRLKAGKYGLCAGCDGKIPVARLNALPYSTLCIKCQREAERDSSWLEDRIAATWGDVNDGDDREPSLAELEYETAR